MVPYNRDLMYFLPCIYHGLFPFSPQTLPTLVAFLASLLHSWKATKICQRMPRTQWLGILQLLHFSKLQNTQQLIRIIWMTCIVISLPWSFFFLINAYISKTTIDEFTLLIASWVIRATWREIQRFVWKFKAKHTVHDSTLKTFTFINQTNKFMFTNEMN